MLQYFMRLKGRLRLTLAGGILLAPAPLLGQAQAGHPVLVVNVMTADGRPVADALVRVGGAGRMSRTDWMGEARLASVPRGRQQVQVARIGYAPAVVDLLIQGDTTGAQFVLERLADTLAALTVSARAPTMPSMHLQEFLRRKAMGIGRFVEDTTFEKLAGQDLILSLPKLMPGILAMATPYLGRYKIISRRGSTRFARPGPCRVDVWLDGVPVAANDASEQDLEFLSPQDLAGAELYSMESAPPQFRTQSKACHVLLLWTRW